MRNLTLLTDFYQLTMMYGYMKCGTGNKRAVFDLFYRGGEGLSYAVAAGLEQAVDYVKNIRFDKEDLTYIKEQGIFDDDFLQLLKNFKFTGDIYAVPEGTVVFPYEPIITVNAPLYQAQLIETALLCIVNHQTLIATKAARLTNTTKAAISEFGLRRAQGPDAGIYGARAAYIGGCHTTSNVLAAKMFGIQPKGTLSHSWVMSFGDELTAFREYAKIYPEGCLLLVDTYDTLTSGVPNAIKVFDELSAKGYKPQGIRLDSGDLAYLSKQARIMLDNAGYKDARIFASSDIDEEIILALQAQDAKIDVYGVGTRLITSYNNPSLGGVYKLAAIEENGEMTPKIKLSNTKAKVTNPGIKKIVRLYKNGYTVADLISLKDEIIDTSKPLTIYHPEDTWKKTVLKDFTARDIMVDIFKEGELVYKLPSLSEIGDYATLCMREFYPEYTRAINPHEYKVDLSDKLYDLKKVVIKENLK